MKYQLLLLILFFICSFEHLVAQSRTRTVQGRLTSEEDGTAVPGANVVIKCITTGTGTSADGNYSLSVPSDGSTTLIVSFIGFKTQEMLLGTKSILNMVLPRDALVLVEVVVSVLGLRKKSIK